MRIKYDNSMYTTIPPEIIDLRTPADVLEDEIIEHNSQESYENQQIRTFDLLEREYFKELIKHESKGKECLC